MGFTVPSAHQDGGSHGVYPTGSACLCPAGVRSSACPRFPQRCPHHHDYPRIFLLRLVNSLQAALPTQNTACCYTPGKCCKGGGCGNQPCTPTQGAVPPNTPVSRSGCPGEGRFGGKALFLGCEVAGHSPGPFPAGPAPWEVVLGACLLPYGPMRNMGWGLSWPQCSCSVGLSER